MITVPACEEGDVRLVPVGNVNGSGRVEMCLDREWRIVGDETWGVEEATVVCRQLGLPTDGQEFSLHKYSGTSENGPSLERTPPLERTVALPPFESPIILIHLNL